MNFELGGISVPILAKLDFTQTYESIGGTTIQRMQSGRGLKQTNFCKLKTILTGQGWFPAGLDGLDYSQPLLLKCAAPRSISSRNNRIVVPKARRKDNGFESKAYGLVKGMLIESVLTFQEDIAMIEPVQLADSYQLNYYPELTVFAEPIQVQANMSSAEISWTIVAEEV